MAKEMQIDLVQDQENSMEPGQLDRGEALKYLNGCSTANVTMSELVQLNGEQVFFDTVDRSDTADSSKSSFDSMDIGPVYSGSEASSFCVSSDLYSDNISAAILLDISGDDGPVKTLPGSYSNLSSVAKEIETYLELNLDFGIEDITECLVHLTSKYHSSRNFKLIYARHNPLTVSTANNQIPMNEVNSEAASNLCSKITASSFSNITMTAPVNLCTQQANKINHTESSAETCSISSKVEPYKTELTNIVENFVMHRGKKQKLERNEKFLPPMKKMKMEPTASVKALTLPFDTFIPTKSDNPVIQNASPLRLRENLTPNIATMQPDEEALTTNCGPTTTSSTATSTAATSAEATGSLARNCTSPAQQNSPSRRDSFTAVRTYFSFPAETIVFQIIKWETKWLNVHVNQEIYPTILGHIQIDNVKDSYASEDEYFNTYFKLHLLSIWCDICSSWKSIPKKHQSLFIAFEEKNEYFKNTCRLFVDVCDIPIKETLILVTYIRKDGGHGSVFGYVYDVTIGLHSESDQYDRKSRPRLKDVLLYFYTDKKIQTDTEKYNITIQKLSGVRAAIQQYDSLVFSKYSDLKSVVWKPANNAHRIRAIRLPPYSHCSSLALRRSVEDIVESSRSPGTLITLVQNPNRRDTRLLILTLINRFLAESTIMVCLRDAKRLRKIAKKIKINKNDYSVLAVHESEVKVAEEFQKCTLSARATRLRRKEKALQRRPPNNVESEVLKRSKIILTVLSNIFLGETKTLDPKTICIIDEAHLATEAETAPALDLLPRNFVLLGDYTECPKLDSSLQRLDYHKTLYHRLFKYVQ